MSDIDNYLVDILDLLPPPGLEIHGPSRTPIEVSLKSDLRPGIAAWWPSGPGPPRIVNVSASYLVPFSSAPLLPCGAAQRLTTHGCVPQRSGQQSMCQRGRRVVGRRFGRSDETTQQFLSPLGLTKRSSARVVVSSRSSVPPSSICRAAGGLKKSATFAAEIAQIPPKCRFRKQKTDHHQIFHPRHAFAAEWHALCVTKCQAGTNRELQA